MSEQRSPPISPRARPLSELAFEGLLERVGELSRSWAVVLVSESPPESIGEVALKDLARDSPGLVSALLKSLRSDAELGQLVDACRSGAMPAARIPALAGAGEAAAVVGAVEALRGVLWSALLDEFGYLASEPARARRLSDLADRLAAVCAAILPAALEGVPSVAASAEGAEEAPDAAPPMAPRANMPRPGPVARPAATIVDELDEGEAQERLPRPEDPPARALGGQFVAEPALASEIEIRDERGDEGPAAWTRSIGRQLEHFEEDRAPFAVLLVELRGEPGSSWEPVEALIASELSGATMTRERAGRYWLLAPGSDRLRALAQADRLTRALEERVRALGMGLSVAVGTAVCPEDGRRASELAAHADVGLYAARSEQQRNGSRRLASAPEG